MYLYDNLDSAEGVPCTCTIYWIYRNINVTDSELIEYVPSCARNQSLVEDELKKCNEKLKADSVETYCERVNNQSQMTTTKRTTLRPIDSIESTTEQGVVNESKNESSRTVTIVLSVLLGVVCVICVVLTASFAYYVYRQKKAVDIKRVSPANF